MPSMIHEALLVLFEQCPELAAKFLRGNFGVGLPRFDACRIGSESARQP